MDWTWVGQGGGWGCAVAVTDRQDLLSGGADADVGGDARQHHRVRRDVGGEAWRVYACESSVNGRPAPVGREAPRLCIPPSNNTHTYDRPIAAYVDRRSIT